MNEFNLVSFIRENRKKFFIATLIFVLSITLINQLLAIKTFKGLEEKVFEEVVSSMNYFGIESVKTKINIIKNDKDSIKVYETMYENQDNYTIEVVIRSGLMNHFTRTYPVLIRVDKKEWGGLNKRLFVVNGIILKSGDFRAKVNIRDNRINLKDNRFLALGDGLIDIIGFNDGSKEFKVQIEKIEDGLGKEMVSLKDVNIKVNNSASEGVFYLKVKELAKGDFIFSDLELEVQNTDIVNFNVKNSAGDSLMNINEFDYLKQIINLM